MPPYASVTSTDFTYTGQRNLPDTGLMDYDARFYSPTLGRFIQTDSIIPSLYNPQSLNRFSYALNNPIRYNDPAGHSACDQIPSGPARNACRSGGYRAAQDELDRLKKFKERKDLCVGFLGLNHDICERGKESQRNRREPARPITGFHYGHQETAGFFIEDYTYRQTDFLFDWHSGTIYKTVTEGKGVFIGVPNGLGIAGYAGRSNVFNIPKSASTDEVLKYLAGPNIDITGSLAADAGIDIGGAAGVSLDVDPSGNFVPLRQAKCILLRKARSLDGVQFQLVDQVA